MLEFDLDTREFIKIFKTLFRYKNEIKKAQIIYVRTGEEYITENINLTWLYYVDSHTFFSWLDFKKNQKQKYNVKNYEIKIKITLE